MRIDSFRVVIFACIVLVFSLILIPFVSADWAMFRGDPSHSGVGIGNPVITPKLLWNYTTDNEVYSSPCCSKRCSLHKFADGNLYV